MTNPDASILAFAGVELDHVTLAAGDVCPVASVIVAEACADVPDAIGLVAIVIESDGDCPTGAVEPDPPHAMTVSATVLRTPLRMRMCHLR